MLGLFVPGGIVLVAVVLTQVFENAAPGVILAPVADEVAQVTGMSVGGALAASTWLVTTLVTPLEWPL
jgi:hypothetical protein